MPTLTPCNHRLRLCTLLRTRQRSTHICSRARRDCCSCSGRTFQYDTQTPAHYYWRLQEATWQARRQRPSSFWFSKGLWNRMIARNARFSTCAIIYSCQPSPKDEATPARRGWRLRTAFEEFSAGFGRMRMEKPPAARISSQSEPYM